MNLTTLFGIFKKSKAERIKTCDGQALPSSQAAASDAEALTSSGIAKVESKDFLGALEAFDKAIQLRPHHPNAYLERSRIKSTLKDHAGANRDMAKAGALLEQMDIALGSYDTGRTKYNTNDYEGAIRAFDKAIEFGFAIDSVVHEIYHARGLARKALEDWHGAFDDFNKSIQTDASHAKAFYDRGLIKFHKMSDGAGALEDYNTAIQINPSYADAYYSRAILRVSFKDTEGALQDLNQAIDLEPTDARFYLVRSLRRSELKDFEGSIQDLTAFIDLAPTDSIMSVAEAYSMRGAIRSITHDYTTAIQDQTRAVELDPSYSKAFFDRAIDLCCLNDHHGAILDFTKVIALDPSNAQAYHSRGLSMLKLGMDDEGRRDLIEAIALGYDED